MKKILISLLFIILFSGCTKNDGILKIGDSLSITGVVEYSDEPSDIGEEYCIVTTDEEIEYCYIDIYEEESKFKSNTFYTKGEDTDILKKYVGKKAKVSGVFDAESHGIPYITDIEVFVEEYQPTEVENVDIKISDVTQKSAVVTVKDKNKEPYTYGEWYKIEKKEKTEWCDIETLIDEYAFHMIGYIPNEAGEVEFKIDWEWLYGKLPSGNYRILKQAGSQYIFVEFEI